MKRLFAVLIILAMGVFVLSGAITATEQDSPDQSASNTSAQSLQDAPSGGAQITVALKKDPEAVDPKYSSVATVIYLVLFSIFVAALVFLSGKPNKKHNKDK